MDAIEILLVKDNPNSDELTSRVLKKKNLANKVFVTRHDEEALEFIYATDGYTKRSINDYPKFILLDLKLPKLIVLKYFTE